VVTAGGRAAGRDRLRDIETASKDVKLTLYAHYNADQVEGHRLQLLNPDKSRTFAAIHMHENRLYIFEGTTPAGSPPPALFQQSLGFLDKEATGFGTRVSIPTRIHRLAARDDAGRVDPGEELRGATRSQVS